MPILLWLLGIPIPLIILIMLLHHWSKKLRACLGAFLLRSNVPPRLSGA